MNLIETKLLLPSELDAFLQGNEITADRVAMVELYSFADGGKVRIGVIPEGLKIEDKQSLDVPYNSPAFIGSIVRAGATIFFEAPFLVSDFPGLGETIDALRR